MAKQKMKTNRSAAKRFRVTRKGKVMHNSAWKSHLLEHKSRKRKRRLRHKKVLSKGDAKRVKKALGV